MCFTECINVLHKCINQSLRDHVSHDASLYQLDHACKSVHGAMLTSAFIMAFLDSWDQHPVQSYADVLRHTRQQLLEDHSALSQIGRSMTVKKSNKVTRISMW